MTPAVRVINKYQIDYIIHHYDHDPRAASYGLEAAQALGQNPQQVFKTLLIALNGEVKNLAVAVIPVNLKLNLKQAAKAAKAKKAEMADPAIAQSVTGYIVGGISPLGQKKALPTFIHRSAQQFETICVSAGKRGLEIELAPQDLAQLTRAVFADLC